MRLALLLLAGLSGLMVGLFSITLGTAAAEGALQAKLKGGEEIGAGYFGRSVVLSADGNTALVSGPNDNGGIGAAWVFTRSGSTWSQQAKLTAAEEAGEAHFGRGVALSADGNIALVSGPNDHEGKGAVWVFTRSGSTWTQQAKLTTGEEVGKAYFGRGVALSAEGDTAVIGGPSDNEKTGAAWVFTRSGATWSQEGHKLTGAAEQGEASFGESVALSADGDTALIGGPGDNLGTGAAWVFKRPSSPSTWTQGPKLTGGAEQGAGSFGASLALSLHGDTALIGGFEDDEGVGAAWVFTRSGSTWTQQGPKLSSSGGHHERHFSWGVALSASGDIAVIGDAAANNKIGGAWEFTRSGSTWTQLGFYLTGGEEETGEGQFGRSVALSSDGETVLIGALGDENKIGAAYVFLGAPELSEPPPEEEKSKEKEKSGGKESAPPPSGGGAPPPGTSPSPTPPFVISGAGQSGAGATGQVLTTTQRTPGALPTGRLALASTRVAVRGNGRAAIRLTCVGTGACVGRLTLTVKVPSSKHPKNARKTHTISIGSLAFSIQPNRTVTVTLKLSARGRALLSANRARLTAGLTLVKLLPSPSKTQTAAVHLFLLKAGKAAKPKK